MASVTSLERFGCWRHRDMRYLINATYLLRSTGSERNVFIVNTEKFDVRGPAAGCFRARVFRCRDEWPNTYVQVLQFSAVARGVCLACFGSHEPRSHDAGRAMSKFHRISATPAIKRRARRGDLTDGRGVSTSTSGTSFERTLDDVTPMTTGDATPKCTLVSLFRVPDGCAATTGEEEKKRGKLQNCEQRKRYASFMLRTIRACIHCSS